MNRLRSWLRLWFTFEYRVSRRVYLLTGLALAPPKYAVDLLLVFAATGRIWSPLDYLRPVHTLIAVKLTSGPRVLLAALVLWALPFLWIGMSMSVRRALDAGLSAWTALLFFVPGLNYVFMAVMSLLPSRPPASPPRDTPRKYEQRLPSALMAMAAGAIAGFGMLGLSVYGFSSYGVSLFLGTPFVMGLLTSFLFNRKYPSTADETQGVAAMTVFFVGGTIFLAAAEGAVCLAMALPLALVISALGAMFGRRLALWNAASLVPMIAVIGLPATARLEANRATTPLREVRSMVIIDASPDVVWRNVVAFSPLPEPTQLIFRAGIAYPQRAWIHGEGVGAVRYCVFSTGSFVEPITHWEPGHRLSFDVSSQPPPLEEWSPYADIAPPHLNGYLTSRRGEFRLISLPDGRTRLEGSTWYEMRLYPEAYWALFGDAFIARIHGRVLRHIKGLSERAG